MIARFFAPPLLSIVYVFNVVLAATSDFSESSRLKLSKTFARTLELVTTTALFSTESSRTSCEALFVPSAAQFFLLHRLSCSF